MINVRQDVYTIIREVLNIDPTKIDKNTPWYELGAESFDLVEVIVAIREHFKLKIKTSDLKKVNSLNDLIIFIEKNIGNKKT